MPKSTTTKAVATALASGLSYEEMQDLVMKLQSQVCASKNEINALNRYTKKLEKVVAQGADVETAFEYLPSKAKIKGTVMPVKKAPMDMEEATYLIHLSDLHIGTEIVEGSILSQPHVKYDFETMEGYFAQIAQKAIQECLYSNTYAYKNVTVLFNGDLLNGEHLEESVRTNEANIQTTLLRGIQMCTDFLVTLHKALKDQGLPIEVIFTSGNHGRWDHQCPSGDFASRNYDTYLGIGVKNSIQSYLKYDKSEGIEIFVASDFEAVFSTFGHNYLVSHGNFAAADQRIKKSEKLGNDLTGRLCAYRMGAEKRWGRKDPTLKSITAAFIGHFHQQVNDRRYGVYVNGSPKGYDHYAEKLNLAVEPAMQSSHVLTRRGVVQSFDLNLERPFKKAEQDKVSLFEMHSGTLEA